VLEPSAIALRTAEGDSHDHWKGLAKVPEDI